MSTDFERNLDKYADVLLKIGLNLQEGQRLLIGVPIFGIQGTPIELAPLVRLVARKAYQAGARLVDVLWNDDQMRLTRFQEAPRDSFEEFPTCPTMDLLFKDSVNWVIATAPVEGWVDNLFPSLTSEDGKAKFWDTIFEICRVKQADPISAWEAHLTELAGRTKYLNHKKFGGLKFTAPGTDLTVGLPEGHLWKGGRMTSKNGIDFTANIPTEEVFTLPHRSKVDGVVSSARPLSYGGSLIEDFTLKFSEGQVVDATAKKNDDLLHSLLETDECARRLGEVALVPNSSPISQTGMLFNNILLDENASSHVALGKAYKFSIENGDALSDDEFEAVGGNLSLIHVDFMIGSEEMDIDGLTEDGKAEPVMRSGEWVFDI
jgi:aminopeptidase